MPPRAANAAAVARPMPPLAPVTTTVRELLDWLIFASLHHAYVSAQAGSGTACSLSCMYREPQPLLDCAVFSLHRPARRPRHRRGGAGLPAVRRQRAGDRLHRAPAVPGPRRRARRAAARGVPRGAAVAARGRRGQLLQGRRAAGGRPAAAPGSPPPNWPTSQAVYRHGLREFAYQQRPARGAATPGSSPAPAQPLREPDAPAGPTLVLGRATGRWCRAAAARTPSSAPRR